MSDRLEEFRRQRGLLREHLAWLDREIAALEGSGAPSRPVEPAQAGQPPLVQASEPISNLDAEAILAEYRQPPMSIQKRAKLGCLVYFGVALALLALAIVVLYVVVKRAHGH